MRTKHDHKMRDFRIGDRVQVLLLGKGTITDVSTDPKIPWYEAVLDDYPTGKRLAYAAECLTLLASQR